MRPTPSCLAISVMVIPVCLIYCLIVIKSLYMVRKDLTSVFLCGTFKSPGGTMYTHDERYAFFLHSTQVAPGPTLPGASQDSAVLHTDRERDGVLATSQSSPGP